MMIIMSTEATETEIDEVLAKIDTLGFTPHTSRGAERTVIGVVGNNPINARDTFIVMDGVDRIVPISRPYKLASREFIAENSTFPLDGVQMGGDGVVLIAGPCAVEDRNQLLETALACQEAGAHALRGGAFKPRTSPYAFQGLGEKALEMMAEVREITGMPVVTEAMSPEQVPLIAKYADVIQIGARNMQNYSLLHAAGESQVPVLLKRGMSATIEELLMAAEYILSHGNRKVILCERGIRTYETS
ncbi:MAG: N-acetylneuraminate synthase family protein, partial [Anaerolineaceae bacterium]|nr:N-acetylneuraminate synthase family protein [Anaerolineaceae bacterium]